MCLVLKTSQDILNWSVYPILQYICIYRRLIRSIYSGSKNLEENTLRSTASTDRIERLNGSWAHKVGCQVISCWPWPLGYWVPIQDTDDNDVGPNPIHPWRDGLSQGLTTVRFLGLADSFPKQDGIAAKKKGIVRPKEDFKWESRNSFDKSKCFTLKCGIVVQVGINIQVGIFV